MDRQFIEKYVVRPTVASVRRHFDSGTGDLLLRGVADQFSCIAQMCDAPQEASKLSAADAEAQNQPLAAERLAKRAQKCGAEAVALHRVG